MGAGMVAFFGAQLKPGIDTVLDTVGFESLAADADFVFTGEGKIDSQSLRGKVVIGIAQRAKKINLPVIAIVGDIGDDMDPAYDMGVSAIYSINRVAVPFSVAKHRSKSDLALTVDTLMRTLKIR
jgi:glycerate kinase